MPATNDPYRQGANSFNDLNEYGEGMYGDEASFSAAVKAWEAGGRKGPQPLLNSRGRADQQLRQSGFNPTLQNGDFYQQAARAGANMPGRANPFSNAVADQSRPAQLALMEQMRAQMNGPSIAGMQGQRAFGASGQQALMQGGRAGMLGAQTAGAGLAGDVGQARLAEMMRAQAGIGGAAGNLRGGDLRTADASSQAGLQMRGLDDTARRFYASQGAGLENAQSRNSLEAYKLREMIRAAAKNNDIKLAATGAGAAAGPIGGFATGGK